MSEYKEQAERFLKAHGLKFKAVYLEHGPHFPGESMERDIWRLSLSGKTLMDGRRYFSVRFGNSLKDSDYGRTPPTAYDLLSTLTKYDPGTFKDFCRELGYSEDSRTAEKTYRACRREWDKVRNFFETAEELEELQDIN